MNTTLLNKLTDQAGFVRWSPEEDPNTPIDWSCDYTKELETLVRLVVQTCAKCSSEDKDVNRMYEWFELN